jgi:ABC-type transporter Mla subunit MlaD
MARDFRHFLDQQDQRQQELARVVSALPQTMGALPELVRQQTRLADLVAQQLMYARQRDEQVEKTLARITQGVEQQRDVMGLVQQQLDLNHESAVQVAQGVTTLARAVEQLQGTSDRSTQALQGLLEKTSERDAELQKQYASVQNWMLGLFIMAFGTLAAGLILAWVALESGRAAPVVVSPTVTAAPETDPATGDASAGKPEAGPTRPPATTLPALGGAPEPLRTEPASATGGGTGN